MEAPSKITEKITTKKTTIIVESRLMKRKETITIDEEEDEEKIQGKKVVIFKFRETKFVWVMAQN